MEIEVLIIGGGLFGQVISEKLRKDGHRVLVVDNDQAHRGSRPAACLMKPSWFSSLGKDIYEPALRLLDDLYGVEDVPFHVANSLITTKVHWVNPEKILKLPDIRGNVDKLTKAANGKWNVHLTYPEMVINAKYVIVAAGIWTNAVLYTLGIAVPGLVGRAGYAFRFEGNIKKNFIDPFAPYRQIVGFNISDKETWLGDGTAMKPENCNQQVLEKSLERCTKYAKLDPKANKKVIFGIRPYTPDSKPAHLNEVLEGLWIATGGAKNGTLAAGHCADKLSRRIM